MTVTLHHGDCLDVMRQMIADGVKVDSIVTDPPYHLTSIVKRFGGKNAAAAQHGTDGLYARASAGFMGKQWDGGDIAFRPETWALAFDLLKPGGHMFAFSGTRTYHRMACAIEDAGFVIRDQFAWAYGSGFPKSHDISKAIDKRGGESVSWFGPWLRQWREENSISQREISALFPSKAGRLMGCVANWELGLNLPTPEQFNRIRDKFSLPFHDLAEAERSVVAKGFRIKQPSTVNIAAASSGEYDITAPSSAAARQWEGWGTAVKPAWEPICLAQKPVEGTIAGNVLKHGVGGLNIDGCRIHTEGSEAKAYTVKRLKPGATLEKTGGNWRPDDGEEYHGQTKDGRFPANLTHDGSTEVLAGFPDTASGTGAVKRETGSDRSGNTSSAFGQESRPAGTPMISHGDSGSAARFFYSSKADAGDRWGSKHPTVKPIDLIRWYARMITPPGGTVLDMFAGSGTLGIAAMAEGFNALLIEREAEYVADIRERIAFYEGQGRHSLASKNRNAAPPKSGENPLIDWLESQAEAAE